MTSDNRGTGKLGGEETTGMTGLRWPGRMEEFYRVSPLPCVSGIARQGVKNQSPENLTGNATRDFNARSRVVLSFVRVVALVMPLVMGILNGPVSSVARAQSKDGRLEFVAADVHASTAPPAGALPAQLRIVPVYADRYELDNATLPDMIGIAWGFQADRVVGGPPWLDLGRIDVVAKLPGGNPPGDQRRVLQAQLE